MADLRLSELGRRLSAREAIGVLADVGEQLARLHAASEVHGDAGAVLLAPDGRAHLGPAPGTGTAGDDVLALGRAVEARLAAGASDLLRRLLATCRCPDPAGRPGADELVQLARRIDRPAVVELRVPVRAGGDAPPASRVRPAAAAGRGRRRVALAAVSGLVLAALWVGHRGASDAGGPSPSADHAGTSAPPAPAAARATSGSSTPNAQSADRTAAVPRAPARAARPDWLRILREVDAARSRAWSRAATGPLVRADAARSPALARDQALVAELRRSGLVAGGWHSRIATVHLVRETPTSARLVVADRLDGYDLRTRTGATHRVPSRGLRTWLVDLRLVAGRWLTWQVRGSAPTGAG